MNKGTFPPSINNALSLARKLHNLRGGNFCFLKNGKHEVIYGCAWEFAHNNSNRTEELL